MISTAWSAPLAPRGRYRIDESAPEHDKIGARDNRSHNIQPRAHATVEDDARSATYLTHDRRQQINCRGDGVQLASPVIRDLDAVDPCP